MHLPVTLIESEWANWICDPNAQRRLQSPFMSSCKHGGCMYYRHRSAIYISRWFNLSYSCSMFLWILTCLFGEERSRSATEGDPSPVPRADAAALQGLSSNPQQRRPRGGRRRACGGFGCSGVCVWWGGIYI